MILQINAFAANSIFIAKENNGIVTEAGKNSLKQSFGIANLPKLAAPTNLTWNENGSIGYISWNEVPESHGAYDLIVYKDNDDFYKIQWSGLFPNEGSTRVGINVSAKILDSGNYTFKIAAVGDNINNITSDFSVLSNTYTYIKPQTALEAPANIKWSSYKPTVALWDSVPNACGYCVEVYYNGYAICGTSGNIGTSTDFLDYINQPGIYTFRVRALSRNIEQIANGPFCEFSAEYNTSTTDPVSTALTNLINEYQSGNLNADRILTGLKDINLSDLAKSMQTSDDILQNVQTLEDAYASEKGINVSCYVDDNISDKINLDWINVVGAAFNAGEGIKDVKLVFSKPDSEVAINKNQYNNNALQFNIDLVGAASGSLSVPVRITMRAPYGINPQRLNVLQYNTDGTYEAIPFEYNEFGSISFTVTSFSTFAIAELLYDYQIDNAGKCTLTGYFGNNANLLVPSEINGCEVTNISGVVFINNTYLKSITIPKSVSFIGKYAFYGCTNLTAVTFFGNTTLSPSAFMGCNNITINAFNQTAPSVFAKDNGYNFVSLGDDLSCAAVINDLYYTSNTGEITTNVYVTNNTDSYDNGFLILAVYDSDNMLIGKSILTVDLKSNKISEYTKTINTRVGLSNFEVKAFLWQDTSSAIPKSKEFTKSY